MKSMKKQIRMSILTVLDIYTNLDLDAQKQLYNIVNTDEYVTYPDDQMQVASTLIDTKTGEVKAQIGGRHIADDVTLGMNLSSEYFT